MFDPELRQFRIVVSIALLACVVALIGRLSVAPMSMTATAVALVCIAVGTTIPIGVGRWMPLPVARYFVAFLLYVGLTYIILVNGGMAAPAIAFLPAVCLGVVLLLKPQKLLLAMLISMLPVLSLVLANLFGWASDPVIVDSEKRLIITSFWSLLATALIGFFAWRFTYDAARAEKYLLDRSQTDHLTSLANRTGIHAVMEQEIFEARRRGTWLSIILFDIDHFKRYNDTNGHNAGDDCLVRVAVQADYCIKRPADLVGRWGGEEFIAILPGTASAGAVHVAEFVRRDIERLEIPYESGQPQMVTISLGVASFCGNAVPNSKEFVEAADKALYEAKQAGRNQVRTAQNSNV